MCIPRKLRRINKTENSGNVIDQSKIDHEKQSTQTAQFKKGCASRIVESVLEKHRKLLDSINQPRKKNSSVSIKSTVHVKCFFVLN